MKRLTLTTSFAVFFFVMSAAGQAYSPAFFGPHALPVPEVSDGRIHEYTTAGFSTDYSFGYGDRTVGFRLDAEIPLVPNHVSFKLWYDVYEKYRVSPAVCDRRGITHASGLRGGEAGDVYVQTRISVLGERKKRPQIILSATLKTASGGNFPERRFYDTPGYWFDVEVAKSFLIPSEAVSAIRLVGQVGFLCWETTGSTQNDAPMYGFNMIMENKWLTFENQIAGYCGWMGNGDRPLVWRSRLTYTYKFASLFFQYQYGIVDFPYHQTRLGCSFAIPQLTPRYGRHRHSED